MKIIRFVEDPRNPLLSVRYATLLVDISGIVDAIFEDSDDPYCRNSKNLLALVLIFTLHRGEDISLKYALECLGKPYWLSLQFVRYVGDEPNSNFGDVTAQSVVFSAPDVVDFVIDVSRSAMLENNHLNECFFNTRKNLNLWIKRHEDTSMDCYLSNIEMNAPRT